MTAYIVTVRPGHPDRYTDSIWIGQEKADSRAENLLREFQRRGRAFTSAPNPTDGWGAWVTPIEIEDARMGK